MDLTLGKGPDGALWFTLSPGSWVCQVLLVTNTLNVSPAMGLVGTELTFHGESCS